MHNWLLVSLEAPRLRLLNAVNIQLEHCRELGPKRLRNSVVVEVQHRDLVAVSHNLLELFVDLDAEKHCLDVEAATSGGSARGSVSGGLNSGGDRLTRLRIGVLSEPVDVLVNDSAEDLDEDWGNLAQLHVEKLKDEDELLANRVNNQFVNRSEHLFEWIVSLVLGLGDGRDDRCLIDPHQYTAPVNCLL